MRGYVEALEAYEQDLPAGVEVDYDKFDKWFRGDSKQQKSLVSLANKTRKGMSLANNLETLPPTQQICRGYMIDLSYTNERQ